MPPPGGGGGGGTPVYGLFGDVRWTGYMGFGLSVLNRVHNFVGVCATL